MPINLRMTRKPRSWSKKPRRDRTLWKKIERTPPVDIKTFTASPKYLNADPLFPRQASVLEEFFDESKGYTELVLKWGKSCISGDALMQKADGTYARVDKIKKGTPIICLNELNHEREVGIAGKPWVKGRALLCEVVLESGKKVKVTGEHRFLTRSGWKKLSELKEGDEIATED